MDSLQGQRGGIYGNGYGDITQVMGGYGSTQVPTMETAMQPAPTSPILDPMAAGMVVTGQNQPMPSIQSSMQPLQGMSGPSLPFLGQTVPQQPQQPQQPQGAPPQQTGAGRILPPDQSFSLPGPDASGSSLPTGPSAASVLASGLPKVLNGLAGAGGVSQQPQPQQQPAQAQQPDMAAGFSKIMGAVKTLFTDPGTNLASSSSSAKPSGGMSYQTPFFSQSASRTTGPVGSENAGDTGAGLLGY